MDNRMKKLIGIHLASVILLFQSYKSLTLIQGTLSRKQFEDLLVEYNRQFYKDGDLIDSYLMRIFEVLGFPGNDVLAHIAGEQVIKYLTDDIDEVKLVKVLLYLKELCQQHPEYFVSVEGFFKVIEGKKYE